MGTGRIAAALVLSLGLHLAAIALLRAHNEPAPPTGHPRDSSEVPMAIIGDGRSPSAGVSGAPQAPRRSRAVRERGGRAAGGTADRISGVGASAESLVGEYEPGLAIEIRGSGDVPGTGLPTNPGARGGGGSGPGEIDGNGRSGLGTNRSSIDLRPFVERLRVSAERCGAFVRRGRLQEQARSQTGLVHFCVDPGGNPTGLSLVESTGDPGLDQSALDCIVPGAAPLPPTDRCLVVPLRFH
jgi:TonB family protein